MGEVVMTGHKKWRLKGEQDKEPLHYKDCGLDDIYLVSGYEVEKTPYGDGISIKNLDQLHKAIGSFLARQKKALSGKELRFLRKQMDLSQSDLGKMLGLTSQQVARWEKGQCEVSGSADILIRGLFIQYAGGDLDLKELARALDEMDSPVKEKAIFENKDGGWRMQRAA
jgi:putative transcriptional regulator